MTMSRRRARVVVALMAATLLAGGAGCSRQEKVLHLPALDVGNPTFATTLAAYAGTGVVRGNRIEVLLNGDEIFPAKLRIIKSARKTINYAQYVWEEGEPSENIANALAKRCREGLSVNILLDAVGALSMPSDYRQRMVDAGCKVESFRPLSPFTIDKVNYRNHRRILIADGLVGITGGSGTSGKWGGNGRQADHWRDTDIWVEGPVVEQLQGAFAENWLETTGIALGGADYFPGSMEPKGQVAAQVIRSSPGGGSVAMYTMYLLAMNSAKRSIDITNPYFLPDEKMIDTLVKTARRGVRVRLLLPGAIDHNLVRQASRSKLGRLLLAGVQIYEYRAALLHAKTMVVDGEWATVGSTNLDNRSFGLNDEVNVITYDGGVGRRLERVFVDDLGRSEQITYQSWKDRGIVSRFLEIISIPVRGQM